MLISQSQLHRPTWAIFNKRCQRFITAVVARKTKNHLSYTKKNKLINLLRTTHRSVAKKTKNHLSYTKKIKYVFNIPMVNLLSTIYTIELCKFDIEKWYF